MGATADVVKALDTLIRQVREDLETAKRAADSIPVLSSDLLALERARALALGNGHGVVHVAVEPGTAEVRFVPRPVTVYQTDMVLNILRTAGRPMTVKEIMAALKEQAPGAKEMTIVSHLVRFVQKGKVTRTAPSTYEIVK